MVMCAVFGCNSNNKKLKDKEAKIGFLRFPKEKKLQDLWVFKCSRSDKLNVNNARVCTLHFKNEDFETNLRNKLLNYDKSKRILKANIFPSENLPCKKPLKESEINRQKRQRIKRQNLIINEAIELIPIAKFGEICRTCLKEEDDLKPLYEMCIKQTCIIEMLMACTFIRIIEEDGLPVQICSACIQEINRAYSFAQKCKKSEILLRRSLFQREDKIVAVKKIVEEQTKEILNNSDEVEYFIENDPLANVDEVNVIQNDELSNVDEVEYVIKNDEVSNVDEIEYLIIKNEELSSVDEIEYVIKNDEVSDVDEIENAVKNKATNTVDDDEIYKDANDDVNQSTGAVIKKSKKVRVRKACVTCNKIVVRSKMKEHMRTHSSEKPYSCNLCGARFTQNGNLRRHLLAHSKSKPFKCELCIKAYGRSELLKDHMRTHTGEKPFVCAYCGSSFATKSSLYQHKHSHSKSDKERIREHQCSRCEKCFATKQALKIHLVIHGEKKFLCSDCGKAFVNMIGLKSHIKIHSSTQPYSCKVCEKKFRQPSSLATHSLIHTGQRSHICSVCKAAFIQRNHLKYHMRTHSGEKPHACSFCAKSFAIKGNLIVHMRTHTGETPYICSVCGKGFHDSSSMKKHRKGHTGDTSLSN